MKKILFTLFVVIAFGFDTSVDKIVLNANAVIKKSQKKHDPNNEWSSATIDWHLQEPRIGNPARMSKVQLDNKTGEFQLIRNRDEHFSTHIIDANGKTKTLFNEKVETDEDLIKEYRLEPNRNTRYRTFYQMLFGLPMSLTKDKVERIIHAEKTVYDGRKVFKLEVLLKEEIFSKYWRLYISRKDFTFLALEMFDINDNTKGERLEFDGNVNEGTMNLPRMHHWYDIKDDTYLGSDMIIQQVAE